jgi:diguanylate cyclase (GGDEF)-like protein
MRRPGPGPAQLGLALAAFAGLSAGVQLAFGPAARPVVAEVTLALLFGWLATWAARESRGDNPLLRPPLLALALVLMLLAALSLGQGVQLALRGPSPTSRHAAQVLELLLMLGALLLGPTLLWMHTAQLARQLGELAMRDPLTRLLNENGLDELMRRHFARRQHEPMVLMLIDVDHMARVNQAHGEAAGDDVLRLIGLALESGVRADDLVARVGGEEFVAGCLGPDLAHAARLAERLRAAVAAIQTGLADGDGHLRVTVSIGLSRPFIEFERYAVAWSEAEVSLQAAKDAGANCVVHPTDHRP